MKNTITTTVLIAAFLFMSSFAANATNSNHAQKNAKESVRQEIIRNINCPDFIESNSETNQVKAIVEVDENGSVTVDEINSANPKLKEYVVEQLKSMKVKSPSENQKFVLVINFKVA